MFFDREQSSKVLKEAFVVVVVLVVIGGESLWNGQQMFTMEQKMFAMEQKMFLEQIYGIEMPCVTVYGRVWPCMVMYDIH